MTPTLLADLRACLVAAEAAHTPELAERLRHCVETLEEMMLLPISALVPPPCGKPVLRVVDGGRACYHQANM